METLKSSDLLDIIELVRLRKLPVFAELPDDVMADLLNHGAITKLDRGQYVARFNEVANDFQIVLKGELAYYKHCGGHDVLTRHFRQGEQVGFDEMLGLINRDGTDVATVDSLLLTISNTQFYDLHVKQPAAFGVFMINLARELSREIKILEDVISEGTGWQSESVDLDQAFE